MISNRVTQTIDQRGVAWATLNNPERHNAFDDQMIAQLTEIFNAWAKDNNIRLILLTAEGKSFSAGADLAWMQRMAKYCYKENLRDAQALAQMLKVLNSMPQPTIARVQGPAFGGAVGLISCCDIAVAASTASFSLSEVKIGLLPATISPYVIAAIGERAARRYFTTAERFDAATAQHIGLISEVTEAQQLDSKIECLIDQLLANGPSAIRQAKQLVFDIAGQPIDQSLIEHTCKIIASVRASDEGREGLSAFLEKRPASWLNRD